MLLRLNKNNPTTCFMVGDVCGDQTPKGAWDFIIRRGGKKRIRIDFRPHRAFNACYNTVAHRGCLPCDTLPEETEPDLRGVLVRYPMFELRADGGVVFMWDDALFDQKKGRYKGELRLDGEVVQKFNIDLHCDKVAVTRIINQVSCTEDESC